MPCSSGLESGTWGELAPGSASRVLKCSHVEPLTPAPLTLTPQLHPHHPQTATHWRQRREALQALEVGPMGRKCLCSQPQSVVCEARGLLCCMARTGWGQSKALQSVGP